MKIYIKCAVSVDNLKSQFGKDIDDKTFDDLLLLDPTYKQNSNKGGKYCPWIFKQYNKGNLTTSYFGDLKEALSDFAKNAKNYTYSDLGRYTNVNDFLTDAEKVIHRELTYKEKAKQLKKEAHNAGDTDKKLLAKDGVWEMWQPLTHAGSISLARWGGKKAFWCTAHQGTSQYWEQHIEHSPMYIFINTSDPGEKYQLQFTPTNERGYDEYAEWYDFNNDEQPLSSFHAFMKKHPKFSNLLDIDSRNYHGAW